jgi:hypothetical protein
MSDSMTEPVAAPRRRGRPPRARADITIGTGDYKAVIVRPATEAEDDRQTLPAPIPFRPRCQPLPSDPPVLRRLIGEMRDAARPLASTDRAAFFARVHDLVASVALEFTSEPAKQD